jgi:hypothetical protein
VDDDLLEHRPALAADVSRERATDETGLDRLATDATPDIWIEAPARALEIELERLQDVSGESARTLLQLELLGGQRQIHASKDGALDQPLDDAVAGRGTSFRQQP